MYRSSNLLGVAALLGALSLAGCFNEPATTANAGADGKSAATEALVKARQDAKVALDGGAAEGAIKIDEAMAAVAADPTLLNKTFVQSAAPAAAVAAVAIPADLPAGDAAAGAAIFTGKGICFTCHTTDGSPLVGPSLKGVSGRSGKLASGEAYTASDAYLFESIKAPTAKVVDGFPPAMPTMPLTDPEIADLIAHLKSL